MWADSKPIRVLGARGQPQEQGGRGVDGFAVSGDEDALSFVPSYQFGQAEHVGQDLRRLPDPARQGAGGCPLPITAARMGHLHDALTHAYEVLGFGQAARAGTRCSVRSPAAAGIPR